MSFDKARFGKKLGDRREVFGHSVDALSDATGIPVERLLDLEHGREEPTGDEVLVLASVLLVDFRFFVSSEVEAPDDKMDVLFRRYGSDVDGPTRRAISELIYLCETEHLVQDLLGRSFARPPDVRLKGTLYKSHGRQAAAQVRERDHRGPKAPIGDVFALARRLNIHVFRRRLPVDKISGLTVHHQTAGPCIVVNLDEDPYRQRFTLAHELAHALLDADKEVIVSFWSTSDLIEVRANTFAADLLVPRDLFVGVRAEQVTDEWFLNLAHQLQVNAETLAIQMAGAGAIDAIRKADLSGIRIPMRDKEDPEVPSSLTKKQRERKEDLLQRGLSDHYVNLCLDAYDQDLISVGRLAEALLTDERGVEGVADLYGRRLHHDA